jgi:acetyl esterase
MPLLPENAQALQMLAEAGTKQLYELSPQEAREQSRQLGAFVPPGPDVARVEDVAVPTADGGELTVRVLVPEGPLNGIITYFHGGGWVIGDIEGYDPLVRKLANTTGYAVANVEYRLAPEYRYPTAVDDCTAAFEWVAANVDRIVGDSAVPSPVPLVVAGDSAGGNLAAVVARRARDNGGPPIAMQVLVYPVADADLETASYIEPENQLLLNRDAMVWFWDHYLPDASQRREPDASPLRAGDLSGLPPALVLTAEYDPLRDEGEAYAAALQAAGVATELERVPGQMHGFFSILILPGHEGAIARINESLSRTVGAPA